MAPQTRSSKHPRLDQARKVVEDAGAAGVTWQDVADALHMHHGSASGLLSRLDALGEVSRLKARHGRSSIYVMTEHVTDPDDVALRRVPKVAPGWSEGYTEGIANGIRQGIDEGHAKGWIDGYDEGVEAGRELAVTEARAVAAEAAQDAQARAAAPLRANAHANQVIGAMLAAVDANNATITHRGDCWKIHPACALRAVRRALV